MLLPHHIQSDGQRVDIGIVIVVDDSTVVHSRLDFQTHGNRCQHQKPFGDDLGIHLHQQPNGNAVNSILYGSIVGKGDGKRQCVALIVTFNSGSLFFFLHLFHKQVGFLKLAAPSKQFHL